MKTWLLVAMLCFAGVPVGCKTVSDKNAVDFANQREEKKKVVDSSKLVDRKDLIYEINSQTLFTGTAVSYYPNGQKSSEGEYRNGREDGKWTFWYENGQKKNEGVRRAGALKGKFTTWYPNGQKGQEGEFRNGKKDGKWTSWSEDGKESTENY